MRVADRYFEICKIAGQSAITNIRPRILPPKSPPHEIAKTVETAMSTTGNSAHTPRFLDTIGNRIDIADASPALRSLRQFDTHEIRHNESNGSFSAAVPRIGPDGPDSISGRTVNDLHDQLLKHQNPEFAEEARNLGFFSNDLIHMGLHDMPASLVSKLNPRQKDHYLLDFKERLEQAGKSGPIDSKWRAMAKWMEHNLHTLLKFKPLGFLGKAARNAHAEQVPLGRVLDHPFYSTQGEVGYSSAMYDDNMRSLVTQGSGGSEHSDLY